VDAGGRARRMTVLVNGTVSSKTRSSRMLGCPCSVTTSPVTCGPALCRRFAKPWRCSMSTTWTHGTPALRAPHRCWSTAHDTVPGPSVAGGEREAEQRRGASRS
jgi:hypothetical protein